MVKMEKIAENKVSLDIEVAMPQVSDALNLAYRKVVKEISLPGFRKGKVPRAVLESRLGPEVLYNEALEVLLPEAYNTAVEETGIQPIDNPEFDLVQMEKGKPLLFKAVVEVKPGVMLGEYRGVDVTRERREITEDDVQDSLNELRKSHAKLILVEGRGVETGDMAIVSFAGYLDGEQFEGGSAESHSVEIGSGSFIPGFEEQIIGMNPGEERELNLTFPDDYHSEELAGRPVIFEVTLREIKRKQFPELNDDFAAEVSEFSTLAELKEDVLNKLKEKEDNRSKAELEKKLVTKVVEGSEVKAPGVLVERELDRMMSEMEYYLRLQGLSMEKFLSLSNRGVEEIRSSRRDEAETRVKTNLVLDAIGEKEGIVATDEEVEDQIQQYAANYGQSAGKVRKYFKEKGQLEVARSEIQLRKVVDLLFAEAKITDVAASANEQQN